MIHGYVAGIGYFHFIHHLEITDRIRWRHDQVNTVHPFDYVNGRQEIRCCRHAVRESHSSNIGNIRHHQAGRTPGSCTVSIIIARSRCGIRLKGYSKHQGIAIPRDHCIARIADINRGGCTTDTRSGKS